MAGDRPYPEEPVGPFPEPPRSFEDQEGRTIELRAFDGSDEEFEALVSMYLDFDSADRAQGIPPGEESGIRDWLGHITAEDCLNVLAWHGDRVAGHATLVPEGERTYELAIFVLQAYQRAGIGTHLIRTLLGYGAAEGVKRVWLTVERWNRPAVSLYKKIGFETTDAESFEMEMALRLASDT